MLLHLTDQDKFPCPAEGQNFRTHFYPSSWQGGKQDRLAKVPGMGFNSLFLCPAPSSRSFSCAHTDHPIHCDGQFLIIPPPIVWDRSIVLVWRCEIGRTPMLSPIEIPRRSLTCRLSCPVSTVALGWLLGESSKLSPSSATVMVDI